MDFELLRQLVTGKPELIYPGSFANQHVKNTDFDTIGIETMLIGLPDNEKENSFIAANNIREQLYRLSGLSKKIAVLDLGNIIPGGNFKETCERIQFIANECIDNEIKIIYLGDTNTYHKVIATSFVDKQVPLNQVWIDSTITWDHFLTDPLSENLTISAENAPLNYINLGYQSYFVEKEILDFVADTNFEAYRLGLIRTKVQDFEPVMRDSNFVCVSLNAVKYSDSPASRKPSPNGLSGDEICQLGFYAGYSNRLKAFAVFDYNPEYDIRSMSASVAAQIIWHVHEGIALKIPEDPETSGDGFSKYHIHLDAADQNLAFYKSNLTNRWWMEVELQNPKHTVVLSCSQKDYEMACVQEIPDRWWRLIKRI